MISARPEHLISLFHAIRIHRSTLCKFFYIYVKYIEQHMYAQKDMILEIGYNILYQSILM